MQDTDNRLISVPLESGDVPVPTAHAQALVFGAGGSWRPPANADENAFVHVQPYRPDFLALQASGRSVFPVAPAGRFNSAFIVASRYRARTESWIESALEAIGSGGWLIVAGGLNSGGDAVAKRLLRRFPGGERRSKHHGVVYFARIEGQQMPRDAAEYRTSSGWMTAPGVFSADEIDPASQILIENLPADISGRVADFGAGWGYLAGEIASRIHGVCHVDLYEADFEALEAAKSNLAERAKATEAGFFWCDLIAEQVTRRYDAIVMNPPFHAGRAADPALGAAFVASAAKALKPGGRLFLVANRPLPYEVALAAGFRQSGEIARNSRFKVLWGLR